MKKVEAVDERRVRIIRDGEVGAGPVLYWMNRDQRVQDNWALLYAQAQARDRSQPFGVLLTPYRARVGDNSRQAAFLLAGLQELAADLRRLHIPLFLLPHGSMTALKAFIVEHGIALLVTDQSPLREARRLVNRVVSRISIPVHQVDAHNIVPLWVVSDKQEFAAYTIRPRLNRLLPEFLTDFPTVGRQQRAWPTDVPAPDWTAVAAQLGADSSISLPLAPGSAAARQRLDQFCGVGLARYGQWRNDPTADAQSLLSAYLNSGQLSAQRVALEVRHTTPPDDSQEAFLEELIVRRELSDNFCWYNEHYDALAGFPEWARTTLQEHQSDPRDYLYSRQQWEAAETHDELWNAAQIELLSTGRIHGYMRMYWAKKLLEWSATPEDALATGLFLNDRYALDGNDPNGYVGVAWSIGGVHDRPWMERDVYGRIRYMNANGCARKFDVSGYIRKCRAQQVMMSS